jgi:hypothetical protein
MVLTPAFLKINPNSLQSLNFEFSRSIKNRRGWTISAGVFLVFAFIAAGIVPACSIKFSPPPAQFPGLSYTFESSKLTIRLVLRDLKPGSDASIDVTKVAPDANKVDHTLTVFEDQLHADANGKLERNIVLDKTATDPITIQYKVVGKDGKTIEASKQLHLAAS